MTILNELSSQLGERSNTANHQVAEKCVRDNSLLVEIAAGMKQKDPKLVADCAEVFTEVAKIRPELIVPFGSSVIGLIAHKNTRARWEATHCLALIAHLIPEQIFPLLETIQTRIRTDESIIVRDYAVDILGDFARAGKDAAAAAYPLLKESLDVWEGRHAGHALDGMAKVMQSSPQLINEIRNLTQPYLNHPKGNIKKAAKSLLK